MRSADWSAAGTEKLTAALLALDTLVYKAVGLDERQFANLESRLFIALTSSFLARARAGVARAVAGLTGDAPATRADVARVERTIASAFDGWVEQVEPTVSAVVAEAYRAGKTQMRLKILGRIKGRLESESPHLTLKAKTTAELKPMFGAKDSNAIKAIQRGQIHWIGRHYDKNMSDRIASISHELMLERGLGRREAGQLLKTNLDNIFGFTSGTMELPEGWGGRPEQYFEGMAANAVTTARAQGAMRDMVEVGISRYEWVNPDDERTCDRCGYMNGRTFATRDAVERMDYISDPARTPEEIKRHHPWASDVKPLQASKDLMADGFAFPPLHFRCRCTVDMVESEEDQLIIPIAPAKPVKPKPPPKPKKPKVDHAHPDHLAEAVADWTPARTGKPVEQLTLEQQRKMREHFDAVVAKHGLKPRVRTDGVKRRAKTVKVVSTSRMAGAHATMTLDNHLMSMRADIMADLRGAAIDRANVPLIAADGTKVANFEQKVHAYKVAIHEAVHAHGPSFYYHGQSVWLEEVTTEAAARRIARAELGLKIEQASTTSPTSSTYSNFVWEAKKAVRESFRDHVGLAMDEYAAYETLELAAMKFKQVNPVLGYNPDTALNIFSSSFDLDEVAKRLGKKPFTQAQKMEISQKLRANLEAAAKRSTKTK